jgi:hypothetical protein
MLEVAEIANSWHETYAYNGACILVHRAQIRLDKGDKYLLHRHTQQDVGGLLVENDAKLETHANLRLMREQEVVTILLIVVTILLLSVALMLIQALLAEEQYSFFGQLLVLALWSGVQPDGFPR